MPDSSLSMVTPITAETFNRLNFNAGMLLHDFDYSSATDAASLMALIVNQETQQNCWFGATKGGINVQENRSTWSPSMDGKRMPFVGETQFDTAAPRITGTLVEYTPQNVKAVSGSATLDEEDNVTTIQPTATIKRGDYFENVVFIGNIGADGLYLVEIDNALCTSGMNGQTTDKDIGTLPFEFTAHSSSPVFTDELPIRYKFFGVAAE